MTCSTANTRPKQVCEYAHARALGRRYILQQAEYLQRENSTHRCDVQLPSPVLSAAPLVILLWPQQGRASPGWMKSLQRCCAVKASVLHA